MSLGFSLKRALVTGAGKGMGRGIALRLAGMGAKVHAISRTDSDLDSLKKECTDMEVYNIDIADWDKTRELVKTMGPIDFLVNNAAVIQQTPFLDTPKTQLDYEFDVNFKAAFNISQVVANRMVQDGRGGSIVNISSISSLRCHDGITSYSTAKAALDKLTKNMAMELGPHNIRVNCINPGTVLTTMQDNLSFGGTEEGRRFLKDNTPLRKYTEVDDIVDTTVFLLSDQSSATTGIIIPVDGGFIL